MRRIDTNQAGIALYKLASQIEYLIRARNITQVLVEYSEYAQNTSELLKAHAQCLVRAWIIDMG